MRCSEPQIARDAAGRGAGSAGACWQILPCPDPEARPAADLDCGAVLPDRLFAAAAQRVQLCKPRVPRCVGRVPLDRPAVPHRRAPVAPHCGQGEAAPRVCGHLLGVYAKRGLVALYGNGLPLLATNHAQGMPP